MGPRGRTEIAEFLEFEAALQIALFLSPISSGYHSLATATI